MSKVGSKEGVTPAGYRVYSKKMFMPFGSGWSHVESRDSAERKRRQRHTKKKQKIKHEHHG